MRLGCEASASVGRKTQNLAPLTSGTNEDTRIGMRKMGLWRPMWALLTCITIRKVSYCSIFCLVFTHVLVCYIVSSFHAIPTKSGSKTITTVNNHHNKDRRSMSSIKNNSSLCKSDLMVWLSLKRWFYYFSAVTSQSCITIPRFDDEQGTKSQRSNGKEYHPRMDRYQCARGIRNWPKTTLNEFHGPSFGS